MLGRRRGGIARRAELVGGHVPGGSAILDQSDDVGVRQHLRGKLACVSRTRTPLVKRILGAARPGNVKSRVVILPRTGRRSRIRTPIAGARPRRQALSRPWPRPSSAFLKSRTFCSDAASTTSATER